MNLPKSLHRRFKDRLLNTVLAPHVDAFVEHLSRGRYAPNTVQEPHTKARRYRAPDALMQFLKTL